MVSEWGESEENWSGNNTYTYVKLADHTNYEQFTNSLANFSQRLVAEKKIENEEVIEQIITDIHLHSQKTFEPENNSEAMANPVDSLKES